MSDVPMNRRSAIKLAAAVPLASVFQLTGPEIEAARRSVSGVRAAAAAGEAFEPAFFTAHEWRTVRILVDLIIPADERSGSATDAGVPEFMDFILTDQPDRQTAMRGGLAWLDRECRERFGRGFADCSDTERGQVLNDIAWPARARPGHAPGVSFFNAFRDLTANGFWSSRTGIADLDYRGNTFVAEWTGCPPEALRKLNVHYRD
ncbi:MAG: gluconate 2-dehydrogenase subunit 3 family protein [Gemmatimonadetes bacterium]|nr:gluconate 2-dehydrogenase subunit 3 family protein [Gemmatimonadota bacterium]